MINEYLYWQLVVPSLNQSSPFPPEVFLDAGPHAGHEVVEVHDNMHTHVEEATESGVPTPNKPVRKNCYKQKSHFQTIHDEVFIIILDHDWRRLT